MKKKFYKNPKLEIIKLENINILCETEPEEDDPIFEPEIVTSTAPPEVIPAETQTPAADPNPEQTTTTPPETTPETTETPEQEPVETVVDEPPVES